MRPTPRQKFIMDLMSDSEEEPMEVESGMRQISLNSDSSTQGNRSRRQFVHSRPTSSANQSASHEQTRTVNKPQHISCNDALLWKNLVLTDSLKRLKMEFQDFLARASKRVMFIFGPSGCGKRLLVQTALDYGGIPWQTSQPRVLEDMDSETEEDYRYETPTHWIERMLSKTNTFRASNHVFVMHDFAIESSLDGEQYEKQFKVFKESLYGLIKDCHNINKYIFLLNSEIYSAFYLLSQGALVKDISRLPNVAVSTVQPYGIREMKKILDAFVYRYPQYQMQPMEIDHIVTLANGDARKALNLVYGHQLRKRTKVVKAQKSMFGGTVQVTRAPERQEAEEEELKHNIYHTLGKFLYAKRRNHNFDPYKKAGKGNEFSRFYNEQEIRRYKPKFYFDPAKMLKKSAIPPKIFVDLLHQNYLARYGSLRDVCDMARLFCYYDSFLMGTINRFEIYRGMIDSVNELMSWGIVVNNRNATRPKSMWRISRCHANVKQKILNRKLEILKSLFTPVKDGQGRTSLKNVIDIGHLLQKRVITARDKMFQHLVTVMGQGGMTARSGADGAGQRTIQSEEEEEVGQESCSRLNEIADRIKREMTERERMFNLMINDDSDMSDIDEQVEEK